MAKALPYFKWYPADAEMDEDYAAMTDQELGFYHRCLNRSWTNDGLPSSLDELARVLNRSRANVDKVWKRVGKKFELRDSRLVNPRQEEERVSAISKSDQSSEAVRIREKKKRLRSSSDTSSDTSNDDPRALGRAGSESESSSQILKDEKSQQKTLSLLDNFGAFLEAFTLAQLPASEIDTANAKLEWRRLDFIQKQAAVKGIRDRVAAGEYQDAAYRPLPQNYLKNRMWQRPIRASPISAPQIEYPKEMI